MSLRTRTAVLLAALLACGSSVAFGLPTYFQADGALPGDWGLLTAERNLFRGAAAAGGVSLTMEGFESFSPGNPLDFGPFTATLTAGTGFEQFVGNPLITTEGNSVLTFFTLGSTAVEFSFDAPINAFGVDITSIDYAPPTTVSFLDDNGNFLNDFAVHGQWAGATFLGVLNSQPFSKARFDFAGSEYLNFDQLEFGPSGVVPEPRTLSLFGLGLVGALGALRGRRGKKNKA